MATYFLAALRGTEADDLVAVLAAERVVLPGAARTVCGLTAVADLPRLGAADAGPFAPDAGLRAVLAGVAALAAIPAFMASPATSFKAAAAMP